MILVNFFTAGYNTGWDWLWVTISSKRYFENPIISKSFKKDVEKSIVHPSHLEKAYSLIHNGLNLIKQELTLN
jgi:hypothetical protein